MNDFQLPKSEFDTEALVRDAVHGVGPPSALLVARYPEWELRTVPGEFGLNRLIAVGHGQPSHSPFADADVETLFRWLDSNGAAFLRPEEVRPSLNHILSAVGDFALSEPTSDPPNSLDAGALLRQLRLLQLRLEAALSLQANDVGPAWNAVWDSLQEAFPGIKERMAELAGPEEAKHAWVVRLWMAAELRQHGYAVGLAGLDDALPHIQPAPPSPLQLLWFTTAFSAGAIAPPFPLPAVYRCSYHRCQQLFLSRKIGVTGARRFCSIEHGKRFYAARRMREKTRAKSTPPSRSSRETGRG